MQFGDEVNEKKRILTIIIGTAIIVTVALLILLFVSRSGNTKPEDYPPSTLEKIKMASTYTEDPRLTRTLACPTIPYLVDVLDGMEATPNGEMLYKGGSYNFLLKECGPLEDSNQLLESMSTAGQVWAETPDVTWKNMIEDKGYANGYGTYYYAGHALISTRLKNSHKYGALYRIVTGDDRDLLLYVYCDTLDKLNEHKELLDAVVGTITRQEYADQGTDAGFENGTGEAGNGLINEDTEVGIQEIPSDGTPSSVDTSQLRRSEAVPHGISVDEESVEHVELDDGSYGTITTDANGVETYEKNKPFEVSEQFQIMCVHYWWENQATPLSVILIGPDGTEYEPSASDSNSNNIVFAIKNNAVGKYILRVETRDVLLNTGLEVMELDTYYLANNLYQVEY